MGGGRCVGFEIAGDENWKWGELFVGLSCGCVGEEEWVFKK